MKLTILGSGSMIPTHKRMATSFLLETDNKKILIDCGIGCLARLSQLKIDPREIDLITISHFHSDHAGDLFNLLHARFVANLYENKPQKSLTIIGPKGSRKNFNNWRKIFWNNKKQEKTNHIFLEGKEINYQVENIFIKTHKIKHTDYLESIGIRIESPSKKLVFHGDIGEEQNFEELINYSFNADLMLIEAHKNQGATHIGIEKVKKLKNKAKIKKVILTHLKSIKKEEIYLKQFTQKNKAFILSEDLMELSF